MLISFQQKMNKRLEKDRNVKGREPNFTKIEELSKKNKKFFREEKKFLCQHSLKIREFC